MRISDWSSDVCSSDLALIQQMSLSAHDQHRPLVAILRPCGKALCDDMLRGAVDRCAELADLGFKLLRRLLERKPGQPGADPGYRLDQRGGRKHRRQVQNTVFERADRKREGEGKRGGGGGEAGGGGRNKK